MKVRRSSAGTRQSAKGAENRYLFTRSYKCGLQAGTGFRAPGYWKTRTNCVK